MINVKVKKIPGYKSPYSPDDPLYRSDMRYSGLSPLDGFEMSISVPSTLHVRLMDDPMGAELARFGKPGEYERYVADRLRHQMLDFIDGQIKQQVAAIAKANRPKSDDDMQYLFKE